MEVSSLWHNLLNALYIWPDACVRPIIKKWPQFHC